MRPKTKNCVHCGTEFDLNSYAKQQAGGKINECPDCVEELGTETAVKYLGLQAGDGKTNALSIVAFESDSDREAYSIQDRVAEFLLWRCLQSQ